jgi:Sulfotransferase family
MSATLPGRDDIGTIDDLHAAATKITGLDDFGDGAYREGLAVLLESYQQDEKLTPFGNKVARSMLRGALVARLMSEIGWTMNPASANVPIERPIFVTGLPRTGTTALHRLLCEDPGHQGLEVWLSELPQPRPPRETWADNPVYQRIQSGYEQHHIANPEFMGVHFISADSVEECWQLLRQSLMSISYESLAHLPTYSRWLAQQDWTPAYERHRRNLQLIGLNDANKRWVLKNPSHLFALDALLAVYPDALIVQTHRDPRTIVASSSSLSLHASTGQSEIFHGSVIGHDQLELWARGAELFMDARTRHNPAQFIDVQYEDFVKDPVATVASIYDHFGLTLTEDAHHAMTQLHGSSGGGGGGGGGDRHSAHRYSLADFGLTEAEVDERFAAYLAAYRR